MMDYKEILYDAFENFVKAIDLWLKNTRPCASYNRIRMFDLYDGKVVWPGVDCPDDILFGYEFYHVLIKGYPYGLRDLPKLESTIDKILDLTGGQPRKILRVLRRIQAATNWCLAQAEGRNVKRKRF